MFSHSETSFPPPPRPPPRGRRPGKALGEEVWIDLLARYHASGLTQTEFAASMSISRRTLQARLAQERRLRLGGEAEPMPAWREVVVLSPAAPSGESLSRTPPGPTPSGVVTAHFPGGVCVELPASPSFLAEVLAHFAEARQC